MVLKLTSRLLLATCPLAGLIGASPALAQPASKTAPLVSEEIKEFAPEGLEVGGFKLMPEFEYIMYADDNVYAAPTKTRSDVSATVGGALEAQLRTGDISLTVGAKAGIRRFFSLSSEDSETANTFVRWGWQPSQTRRVTLAAGWNRSVEERGEPEALIPVPGVPIQEDPGPRKTNIWELQSRYSEESGRLLLNAEFATRKYDVLGPQNGERDFTSYSGSVTVGTAVGSRFYATATAFSTHRDFVLPVRSTGLSQNETTFGGRLGIATRERGLIEGRAQIGLFRLNPVNPTQKSRTGLSADVSLTLRPQRRTALTLDIFSGEVATFRLGASARSDTNILFGVQQEIRHNFYGTLGLAIRRTEFFGTTDVEKTLGPRAEIEWLANKVFSLSGTMTFNHRTSNVAEEVFDRFRVGISLRARF
jgi:hypothetical protein